MGPDNVLQDILIILEFFLTFLMKNCLVAYMNLIYRKMFYFFPLKASLVSGNVDASLPHCAWPLQNAGEVRTSGGMNPKIGA